LVTPYRGRTALFALYFIYTAKKCRTAKHPIQDVLAPSSSLNSTQGMIIVNMARYEDVWLCFFDHTIVMHVY
jgi:hypothetical protein